MSKCGCDWVCSYSGHALTMKEEATLWFEDVA